MTYGRNNPILRIFTASWRQHQKTSRNRDFPFPVHPLLIPCSDSSGKRSFLAKPPYIRDLSKEGWIIEEKFPVFFPVSRELGAENSSPATASTATQSSYFSLFFHSGINRGFRSLTAGTRLHITGRPELLDAASKGDSPRILLRRKARG